MLNHQLVPNHLLYGAFSVKTAAQNITMKALIVITNYNKKKTPLQTHLKVQFKKWLHIPLTSLAEGSSSNSALKFALAEG